MATRRNSAGADSNNSSERLNCKLAAYATASAAIGAVAATEAEAVVVSNSTPQAFGINGHVNIDFNGDTQIDFQIDHDRVQLSPGTFVDYLQIDKNDVSSAENPLPIGIFTVFPDNGTPPNSDHDYVTGAGPDESGYYPSALTAGTLIGPSSNDWDFQENNDFIGSGLTIRANRLIDEDHTQVDAFHGDTTTIAPFGTPGWIGLGGQTRYLGVRIDFNDAGFDGFNNNPAQYWYGWIGVRITNEGDATGEVTGWGYETEIGMPIDAGEIAVPVDTPGDFNKDGTVDAADYVMWRKNNGPAGDYTTWKTHFGESSPGAGGFAGVAAGSSSVPEPSSLLFAVVMGVTMICSFFHRRVRGA